jgi:transposase
MAVRGLGCPVRFTLTAGQKSDAPQAATSIEGLPAEVVMADTAYDADHLRQAATKGALAVITNNPSRAALKHPLNKHLYAQRYLMECGFSKLKQFRRAQPAYHVSDPEQYGVVTFGENNRPAGIDEKPARPRSNWVITGIYFFDNDVVRHAMDVRPSARGELEITDLQMLYLSARKLSVEQLGRGFAWLDTGTFGSLIEPQLSQTLQIRQGMKVACLERSPSRVHRSRASAHLGQIIGERRLRST